MEKRTRQWRRRQAARVFKARLKYQASICMYYFDEDGVERHPTWKELATAHWAQIYRTTGTPCSCWLCQGESYNRLETKRETRRILNEEGL